MLLILNDTKWNNALEQVKIRINAARMKYGSHEYDTQIKSLDIFSWVSWMRISVGDEN